MGNQTSSRDHVRRHAIANKQDDVLRPSLLGQVTDRPVGFGRLVSVVGQGCLVLARLVQCNPAVCLGGDIDQGSLLSIFRKKICSYTSLSIFPSASYFFWSCKPTFIPRKVPPLKFRLFNAKILSHFHGFLTLLGDGELEIGVWFAFASLRAVHGRVYLQPNIKVLSSQEFRPSATNVLVS